MPPPAPPHRAPPRGGGAAVPITDQRSPWSPTTLGGRARATPCRSREGAGRAGAPHPPRWDHTRCRWLCSDALCRACPPKREGASPEERDLDSPTLSLGDKAPLRVDEHSVMPQSWPHPTEANPMDAAASPAASPATLQDAGNQTSPGGASQSWWDDREGPCYQCHQPGTPRGPLRGGLTFAAWAGRWHFTPHGLNSSRE